MGAQPTRAAPRIARRPPVLANLALKQDTWGQPLFLRITVFDISDRRAFEREAAAGRAAGC